MLTTGATPTVVGFTGHEMQYQPSTLTEALLMEGTRQWKAADGAYVVGSFNGVENPVCSNQYVQPILIAANNHQSTITLPNVFYENVAIPSSGLAADRNCYWQPNKFAPINQSGVMLTGLSEQTTLTITLKAYYEQFPGPAEPLYAVLAKPSACFDPVALQMYLHALQSMPIGVPVDDNDFGDWFAGIVSEFAPMIGNALNTIIPGAGLVGSGAKFLADRYLDVSENPRVRKERVADKKAPNAQQQQQKKKKKKKKKKPVVYGPQPKPGSRPPPRRK